MCSLRVVCCLLCVVGCLVFGVCCFLFLLVAVCLFLLFDGWSLLLLVCFLLVVSRMMIVGCGCC